MRMTLTPERYSPEDVLRHVDDAEAFRSAFDAALRRREEAKQQFVDELSPEVKAEWIAGEPVFHSPARHAHNAARSGIETILKLHCSTDPRVFVCSEKAMMRILDDLYEPDVAVWLNGGDFADEMVLYPPCDLVVEILSKKTAATDRGRKFRNYAKAGILEYWIVDADKHTVEQFEHQDGVYAARETVRVGRRITSLAVPGFTCDVDAFFGQAAFAAAVVSAANHLQRGQG